MSQDGSTFDYTCSKCGNKRYEVIQTKGSSDGIMSFWGIDDLRITLVACRACRFTDTYLMSRVDFMRIHGLQT